MITHVKLHRAVGLLALGVLIFWGGVAHAETPDVSSGLELYYAFDAQNALATDYSTHAQPGVLSGTELPVYVATTSARGGSAYFVRTGTSHILAPASVTIGSSYTKSIWVNPTVLNSGMSGLISHPGSLNYTHALHLVNTLTVNATNIYSNAIPKAVATIVRNEWTHLVVTYDAGTRELRLYKNGVLTSSTPNVNGPTPNSPIIIGSMSLAEAANRTFTGYLDEARVYSRALSADDVQFLYQYDRVAVPAPANIEVEEQPASVTLSWTPVPLAHDYIIEYKRSSDASYSVYADDISSVPSVTISGMQNGAIYNFRVYSVIDGIQSLPSTVVEGSTTAANEAPVASAVSVSSTESGQVFAGAYEYTDIDNDPQATSTFRWLRAATSTEEFVAIAGASDASYTAVPSDNGQYLMFEVTPIAESGSLMGTPVRSDPVQVSFVIDVEPVAYAGDLLSGLQFYYSFDTPNELGRDYSGWDKTATLVGAPLPTYATTTSARGGSAYVTRVGVSRIDPPASVVLGASYTKSLWVHPTISGSGMSGLFSGTGAVNLAHTLHLVNTTNVIATNQYSNVVPRATTTIARYEWTHLAVAYDAGTRELRLFKNGVLVSSTPNVDPVLPNSASTIGSYALSDTTNKSFTGYLDEVRLYDRALTADDISYLYQYDRLVPQAPLGVRAQSTNNAVKLSWAAVSGATDYIIEYKAAALSSYKVFADGVSTQSLVKVTGLSNGTAYDFRVRTSVGSTTGPVSVVVNATPSSLTYAPVASNVLIQSLPGGASLQGSYTYSDVEDDLEGVTAFRWLRGATPTGPFTAIPGAETAVYELTEEDGGQYLKFEVTPVAQTGILTGTSVQSPSVQSTKLVKYYHLFSTGQSLSLGAGPAYSLIQPYSNLTLSQKNIPPIGTTDVIPLIPLVAAVNATGSERPHASTANTIAGYTIASGTNTTIVATSHGQGGARYELIKKGTAPYLEGMNEMVLVKQQVEDVYQGLYRPFGIMLIHGESDASSDNTAYDADLVQLQYDYQTDINQYTGRNDALPMFFNQTSQVNPLRSALLQLKTAREHQGTHYLVGPIYQFTFASDGLHLLGNGSRQLGELIGKVAYKVRVQGESWYPLMPTSVTRNGADIFVDYHVPVPPIQFDVTQVVERANKGFVFWQTGGNTVTISSVSIVDADTIKVTLSDVPTGSSQFLSYAINPDRGRLSSGNPLNPIMHGGNVRDSDTSIAPGPTSSELPLYNWGVTFKDPVVDVTPQ